MPTPVDREIEREVIREHLRRMIDDVELDAKTRLQAMSMLGKDAGMWKESEVGAVNLQVLIADLRGGSSGTRPEAQAQRLTDG